MITATNALMEQYGEQLLGPNLADEAALEITGEAIMRYSEPWRAHHTVSHLLDIGGFLIENVDELRNPRATLWAATGHDGIYIPQAPSGVNEELSARWIKARLSPYLNISELELISGYIQRTTRHEWDGKDLDLALFLDADLKILGAQPEEFEDYDRNIRREYGFVDLEVYRKARAGILRDFYNTPRLFITDTAHEQFGDQAKANLERKIIELLSSDAD